MSFPRYPAYKDSGVEWLGSVPSHWTVKRLRRVVQLNPSKSETAKLPRSAEVTFLPMEAIGEDGSLALDRVRPIGELESGYTYFAEGDVAIAKITPCFENGKGAVMRGLQGGLGFGTTELIVARPWPQHLDAAYLHRIFTSRQFMQRGEASMYGAGGQKRVPDDFVRDFAIALPPVDEQVVINAFLNRETAKIDALVAEQERLIELLKEKRQAVISHAVTKGLDPSVPMKDSGLEWLGEVPAHWDIRSVARVSTKITNGYVGPTREILVDSGVPYVQATHIKGGQINFDGAYFVTPEWSEAHSKSILAEGDVLLVQTGAGTGDVGLVSAIEVGFNCHALIIVAPDRSQIQGAFLSAVLQSAYGRQVLESVQTGAMHPHLNCGEVKFVSVPVPPLKEQEAVAAFVENATERFESLTAECKRSAAILQESRTALISAAVTGQIDVRGWVPAEGVA